MQELFFNMIKIRRIEEKIVQLYPAQQIRCLVHFSIGQEAVGEGA